MFNIRYQLVRAGQAVMRSADYLVSICKLICVCLRVCVFVCAETIHCVLFAQLWFFSKLFLPRACVFIRLCVCKKGQVK